MRIWSLHPKYLDTKGLVALWRETLLAKHVLEGRTKGYTRHPQLTRFKNAPAPLDYINYYLSVVYDEACTRSYTFDQTKFKKVVKPALLQVTSGQVEYEAKHLLRKLKSRDLQLFLKFQHITKFDTHPLFKEIAGEIEPWEII